MGANGRRRVTQHRYVCLLETFEEQLQYSGRWPGVETEECKWVQEGGETVDAHLDKARMCTPAINDAPADTRKQPGFALSVNVIKTAARRATAVLRVLRKRNRALHAILLHPSRGLVRQRVCIAERDVALVGCRRRVELVEQRHQAFALRLRPA